MTPDELRAQRHTVTLAMRDAVANALVHQVSKDSMVYDSAIEMDRYDGVDGADLVWFLATMTDEQRAAAWQAALDSLTAS